jgi:RNA polymerase sigma factor (sigma-70 family)
MTAKAANEGTDRNACGNGGGSQQAHREAVGDRAAQDAYLERAYAAEAAALRGRLLALTRNPAIAEDVVAAAFVRLVAQVRAGDAPEDAGAWLYRVGYNLAISGGRRQVVATRAMPGLLDRRVGESPEEEIVRRERDDVVREALSTLDEDDRELVLMAASGYRPVEIAVMIGRSSEATRTRLCRARGRLRGSLLAGGLLS